MKLYFAPFACSLSPHIVLREAGLPFELVQVDLGSKKLADGSDYRQINPLGYVPLLELDDGTTLTEGPAITQYLADRVPERKLAPANGTLARYQLQSLLNFISTELHKSFGPLFDPSAPEAVKSAARTRILARLGWIDGQLAGRSYLAGADYSIADVYLYVVTNWAVAMTMDLSGMTHLAAWRERVGARPAVQAAQAAETQAKTQAKTQVKGG